ncbi:MAG: hypothetical protein IJR44_05205, partial [Neisseriaceae bacterium]|nr:hypothetical protein [Neisseriaceae bacterium]
HTKISLGANTSRSISNLEKTHLYTNQHPCIEQVSVALIRRCFLPKRFFALPKLLPCFCRKQVSLLRFTVFAFICDLRFVKLFLVLQKNQILSHENLDFFKMRFFEKPHFWKNRFFDDGKAMLFFFEKQMVNGTYPKSRKLVVQKIRTTSLLLQKP